MFFLVYVSAAVTWFSTAELRALLLSSQASNEAAGITGMLLYKDGNFMQALEGDEAAVRALYGRIEADLRHRGMLTIDSGHAQGRQFDGWSMGFFDLGADAALLPAGYREFSDLSLSDPALTQSPGRCQALLQLFSQLD